MLRAWKTDRHRYVVECDACTSRGTPAVLIVRATVDPGSATVRAATLAEAQKTRVAYEGSLRDLVRQQRTGKIKAAEVGARVKELARKHAEDLREALASSPGFADGVAETVDACPWCGASGPATVQVLQEGAHEPPEWAAKRKVG